MDFKAFLKFMSEICDWVQFVDPKDETNERHFLRRLYNNWDSEQQGVLTFQIWLLG